MKEMVEKMIEKVESFKIEDDYWHQLKKDTLRELETKSTPDNQWLWLCIKLIAEYMAEYTM